MKGAGWQGCTVGNKPGLSGALSQCHGGGLPPARTHLSLLKALRAAPCIVQSTSRHVSRRSLFGRVLGGGMAAGGKPPPEPPFSTVFPHHPLAFPSHTRRTPVAHPLLCPWRTARLAKVALCNGESFTVAGGPRAPPVPRLPASTESVCGGGAATKRRRRVACKTLPSPNIRLPASGQMGDHPTKATRGGTRRPCLNHTSMLRTVQLRAEQGTIF